MTREASSRPSAGSILGRPFVQAEIKRMLAENKSDVGSEDPRSKAPPMSARIDSSRDDRDSRVRPLGDHNPRDGRGRAPSIGRAPMSARAPSPHKGAAMEVLKPSRAPSPAQRMTPR
ncbi:unnamed protein product [Polarella glacialis]|uniref:Uncharacterized protein n=1 Tax=Polarella glacialis TaxID=89957 RepID=A0A813FUY0_POLGL|nr:unnamed protein product [Polarella glacialis]